jgi:DNA modification methylase
MQNVSKKQEERQVLEIKPNNIYLGDCIELLKNLPDNSVDLIFADPPYNMQLGGDLYRPNQTKVSAVDDEWDKFTSAKEYDSFCKKWLSECQRVVKPTGSIWVIGSYHNIFRVGTIMQDVGFWILNDVIWLKTNPMPNFKGTRFNNAHETLIWASKSKDSRYTFHYHSMKCMNDDLQMRSDWFIPICSGEERIKIDGKKAHSTQKPAELLYRVIISSSNFNDIVLDPFFGSGTTGAVAKRLGRKYIGFEKEKAYLKIAEDRINKIVPLSKDLLQYNINNKKPKVAFGTLIEKGFVKIGEQIFSPKKDYIAIVNADSSVSCNNITDSIHKVSAKLINKENNNGWGYWYVSRNSKMVSIDELRYAYEEKFNLKNSNNFTFEKSDKSEIKSNF